MPFKSAGKIQLIKPQRFSDERGFFAETYNRQKYIEMGFDFEFVQDNQSISQTVGTLRGLHFQKPPRAQEIGALWARCNIRCRVIFGWAAQLMVVGKVTNLQQKMLSDLCARWICSWLCHFSA